METVELENTACNFCQSKDNTLLYASKPRRAYYKEMFYPTSASFHTERIVKCRNCGLVFANPRIRADILLKFYAEGEDKNYIQQMRERIRAFERGVGFIERFCPKGAMLDIGCGAGFLIHAAQKKGWTVKGIEINSFFTDFANKELNLEVVNKSIEEADFRSESFDVIVAWDILEHLPDPYLALSKAYRWLKNGGCLFINTPNINSIFAKVMRSKWWFMETMHLYYFSPQSINMYFDKVGFKYLKKRCYIPALKLRYLLSKCKWRLQSRFLRRISDDIIISYYAGQMTVVGRKGL